jgi:AcrR family transcriptional regulator
MTPTAQPRAQSPRKPVPLPPSPAELSVARERLLDTAADLFYRDGIRAVGVDLVVERSGVAKTSLYRHFGSKDDLIAAVLERDDTRYWTHWDRITARESNDARDELLAQVRWIAQYIGRREFRGCAFLNAATEFPDADHPARQVALRHKAELRRRVGALTRRLQVHSAAELADQLVLLIDGAYINGQLRGRRGPAKALPKAAAVLLQAAVI